MIYFVQADIIGRIKIGRTTEERLAGRMSSLQSASPVPLNLLLCTKGGKKREARLHEFFKEYRVLGEWFHPGEKLVSYIAKRQGVEVKARLYKERAPGVLVGRVQNLVLDILKSDMEPHRVYDMALALDVGADSVRKALLKIARAGLAVRVAMRGCSGWRYVTAFERQEASQ